MLSVINRFHLITSVLNRKKKFNVQWEETEDKAKDNNFFLNKINLPGGAGITTKNMARWKGVYVASESEREAQY